MVHFMVREDKMATGASAANGTRRANRSGRRHVRSYGIRRVYSYGERHSFSYGDRYMRMSVLGRERLRVSQRVIQHGRGDSSSWDRKRIGESDKELLSTGVGTMWVAGYFLNTFSRNLDFGNLPAVLKVKLSVGWERAKERCSSPSSLGEHPCSSTCGRPGCALEVSPR